MNQQHVEDALRLAGTQSQVATIGGAKCAAARTVYTFLSGLIDGGANWFERQVLRTVRSFVKSWMDKSGCSVEG